MPPQLIVRPQFGLRKAEQFTPELKWLTGVSLDLMRNSPGFRTSLDRGDPCTQCQEKMRDFVPVRTFGPEITVVPPWNLSIGARMLGDRLRREFYGAATGKEFSQSGTGPAVSEWANRDCIP
jgi:hypothetical protein